MLRTTGLTIEVTFFFPIQINGFGWCQFVRPISPQSVYDLDFRKSMYHFYLWGNMTEDLRYVYQHIPSSNGKIVIELK
jgi:hypothetical protein